MAEVISDYFHQPYEDLGIGETIGSQDKRGHTHLLTRCLVFDLI